MFEQLKEALKQINDSGDMCYPIMVHGLIHNDGFILGDLLFKLYRIDKKLADYITEERTQLMKSDVVEEALISLLGIKVEE